jgi:hypothetical protein
MKFKTIAGLIGLVAVLAFLAAPVIKLHKLPLILVALIGAGMAVYEFYEGLRSKDDSSVTVLEPAIAGCYNPGTALYPASLPYAVAKA